MKIRALLTMLVLGSLTCGPDKVVVAKADLPHDTEQDAPEPTLSPAAALWQKSVAAETAGNFEGALSALTELPPPQRDGYLANFRRGWLLYRAGRYTDAVTAYNAAMLIDPAGIEARVALLVPLMALKKWNDVASAAQEVLKRDPENYLASQRLAYAKFSMQRYPEAELLYRRLVELYPGDVEMRAG
ncbi:MAG TPA: tetratricopeptide repeat protein, partial [Polyangiales bacterium]